MCVSNNAIELQACHFFEKILDCSTYKVVRVDFVGGTFIESDLKTSLKTKFQEVENIPLIKEVILQTKAGKQFTVEPDELGLQFANGDLSYRQYLLEKKQTSLKMLGYTSRFIGLFTAMAWGFFSYFL